MQVGITGASGFIGQHLVRQLNARGHGCVAFSRSPDKSVPGCVETRGTKGNTLDLHGLDAAVNLAGESILGVWTQAKRARIRDSRVAGTARLVASVRAHPEVRVLVSGSAVGFYGDGGERELTEDATPGRGFLADVSREWEAAALAVEKDNAHPPRMTLVRTGFVLGREGGAYPSLRRIFRLGLGGRLGDGKQWTCPVHVADVAGLIVFLLEHGDARGPFNAVCPEPVRNADFTRALARALHRPAVAFAPAWALGAVLGEESRVVLDSQRVVPARALAAGYEFGFPTLASMLDDLTAAP